MGVTVCLNESGVLTHIIVPEGESLHVVRGAGAAQRDACLFGHGRYGSTFDGRRLRFSKNLISARDTEPSQDE